MNDRTRPPLDELRESWVMEPGDTHTVAARYRRDAWWFENQRGDSLFVEPKDVAAFLDWLAAYQPTGPDDLAGLLREVTQAERSFDIDTLARELTARGVTLTGVRSSEASEGSEADSEAAARSSEVDGLREALDEYGAAMREFKYAKGERRRRAARTRWEHAKNRLDAALTGDTGPKVEPEPHYDDITLSDDSPAAVLHYGHHDATPEPSNDD